jgi:hypothetical protein
MMQKVTINNFGISCLFFGFIKKKKQEKKIEPSKTVIK